MKHFNSHPHEEDDIELEKYLKETIYFNSHPHEEDDKDVDWFEADENNFNSHPHEEDDLGGKDNGDGTAFQLTSSRRG